MITIDSLRLIQNSYRDKNQIIQMIEFVKSGGFFTQEALSEFGRSDSLIEIAHIQDDDSLFLHDGLHRVMSIWLAGRKYIRGDEYNIVERSYDMYSTINFAVNYVTPFNIKTECRGDIGYFKYQVNKVLRQSGEQAAIEYINNNRSVYLEKKRWDSIKDMANDTFRNSRSN